LPGRLDRPACGRGERRHSALTAHGGLALSIKRKSDVGWFLALPEILGRFMEDARAMSRAMRWMGSRWEHGNVLVAGNKGDAQ
jgi:hypothetical protein